MLPDQQHRIPKALRIGIVIDSFNVSAWKTAVLDDLIGADFIELAVTIVRSDPESVHNGAHKSWLFDKYVKWDTNRVQPEDDPLREVDISSRLTRLPGWVATSEVSAQDLTSANLDVLIWLSDSDPDLAITKTARFGVWLYRSRQPEHFWEIYETNPVTRSALEVLSDGEDRALTAYEGYSATQQGWSWYQNRRGPSARASTFALRCLRQLHAKQPEMLSESGLALSSESVGSKGGYPTNLQVANFLVRNAVRTVSRRILYANKESYWFVGYRSDPTKFVANTGTLDLTGFERIEAPRGHFYADPFVLEWRGKNYLFVEDYLLDTRRGCISVMEISSTGVSAEAETVLDRPYHLSYPFVFEHERELYMIPETLEAGRIELYRAVQGPTRWEFLTALKENVQAVDTTLWVQNGLFYFFTNIAERGATVNDELYLFYSESLFSKWKPHPCSPIVTDVRRSRGAGKIFWRNGKLIRPSQDCSLRYGYACQLNEIEVLSPTDYRERALQRIEPNWSPGLIGTHTLNSNASIEVIDGQIYRKRHGTKKLDSGRGSLEKLY